MTGAQFATGKSSKNRLIKPETQDSDPSTGTKGWTIISRIKALLYTRSVFAITTALALLASLGTPNFANAGVFSVIGEMLSRGERLVYVLPTNSQNMALLEAATNYDPVILKGGGDIITEDGALFATVTPEGKPLSNKETRPGADQISVYVVRAGDNISSIAELFGVTTNTIRWANDIKPGDIIRVG